MKKEYPDILKLEGEKWHNPDPATGKLGTRVPAEWLQTTEDSLKSLTLEMLEVLKAAGINPNELNNTQVRDAIQKMILARVINYNDIVGRPIVKDSLGDDRNNPASQRVVNDVNRDVVTAQKTANTANDKANSAQNRADSAYNLASKKRDKTDLWFEGTVNIDASSHPSGDAIRLNEGQAWIGYHETYGGLWAQQKGGDRVRFPNKGKYLATDLNLIGVDQKWIDVTSLRSLNTTYTNNTGKPIAVFVTADTGSYSNLFYVDDVGFIVDVPNEDREFYSIIIPNGSTYKVVARKIVKFLELR